MGSISFWRIYTILLHLLMPVTAFGSILFYFLKIFGWFRYTLFRGDREIILFSNLTDKTKAYAKRIDSKDRLLIFCNTEDKKTISLYTVSGHPEAAAIMDNLMKRGTEAPLLYKQTTIGDNETHLKAISTLLGDPDDPEYLHKIDLRFVKSIPDLISAYYRVIPAGEPHES